MKARSTAVPVVSLALSALLFAMTFMMDARPPKELQFISGVIADRQALYTRDRLSGFRIHVGRPKPHEADGSGSGSGPGRSQAASDLSRCGPG
ncbi:hypothetical protein [Roseateles sp.]|uniref:hypothetical protein n=1 Tax=Roseateles sp. TaxID=1971397 RepID=UPI002F40A42C